MRPIEILHMLLEDFQPVQIAADMRTESHIARLEVTARGRIRRSLCGVQTMPFDEPFALREPVRMGTDGSAVDADLRCSRRDEGVE